MNVALTKCVKANSYRHTRHDKTVLSVSRPLRRCELSRPDNRVQRRVCDRWTHSDAERTCWPVGPTQSTPPDTKRTALVVSCRVLREVWIGHYTRCFFLYRKRRPKRPQNLVISFILCAWFFINFLNFVTSCRLVTEWKRRTDLWIRYDTRCY